MQKNNRIQGALKSLKGSWQKQFREPRGFFPKGAGSMGSSMQRLTIITHNNKCLQHQINDVSLQIKTSTNYLDIIVTSKCQTEGDLITDLKR